MKADIFEQVQNALAAKQPCAVVTDTVSGKQIFVTASNAVGSLSLTETQKAQVRVLIAGDRSAMLEEGPLFVRVYGLPVRMIIVGAVHIAKALAPMAAMAGFDVTLIDPREAFVRAGRLDNVKIMNGWPDEALAEAAPDSRTAIVTLTHDTKLDDPALAAALKSDAFYIGSLGSTRTHAKRLQRLKGEGFTEEDLSRIHGPVGLNIKAKSPAEIAVSILAEVIQTRRAAS